MNYFGSGVVYELFPEITGSGMDAELRVFARLPEADDTLLPVMKSS